MTIVNFIKDFINVLSGSSISFLLLSSTFIFILYYNLSGGTLKSKGGGAFIAFGVLLLVAGVFVRPLLYLGVAYFLIMFWLTHLGGRLWDTKVGLRLGIGVGAAFGTFMLDPSFRL